MKFSTGFAVILLGTASVATAEPTREENTGRVSYTKADAERDAPRRDGDWVELATPTPAKHGTEFVVIGKDAGSFSQLRIDAHAGRVILRHVRVFFDDGTQHAVVVDRILDRQHGKSAVVELGGTKRIDRIVVTTEPDTGGSYAIYGSSGAGVAAR